MVTVEEYLQWDATDMAALVAAGEVTAAQLADAAAAVSERWGPELGAIADLADGTADSASVPAGPFRGVPFGVKELLGVPGLAQTFGSRMFAHHRPAHLTPYVQAMLATGVNVLCSTTSSEFGLLGSTESLLRGPTANPWAAGVSAGGSSGGAAAAVAAGILPLAHASDAGGSIRIPASMNGVFGFKPSNLRCEPNGPAGPGFASLVVEHVITRSVRDSATMLLATQRRSSTGALDPIAGPIVPLPRRLRIGIVTDTLLGARPDDAVGGVLDEARASCAALGHDVVDVALPPLDAERLSLGFFSAAATAMAQMADMVTPLLGRRPGGDELEPFTLELIEWAPAALDPVTVATLFSDAGNSYRSVFASCDAVLSPTLPTPPWTLGRLAPTLDRAELVARTERTVGYTPIHNIAGCPAMSVPLGWVEGLPVGVHVAADVGHDAMLLGLAFELEEAAPWRNRRPRPATASAGGSWPRS